MTSAWERDLRAREQRRRDELAAVPILPMRHHLTLPPEQDGDRIVTASVGPAGEAVALWSTRAGGARVTVDGTDGRTQVIAVDAPAPSGVTLQPLPGGRLLLVTLRCGPDARNAVVLGPDGLPELDASLGDGIAHVLATATGVVWVGYFDEGVSGVALPLDVEPIGAPGLVRFSAGLLPEWRYDAQGDWGSIRDCYALNVTGDSAWACYYSKFPLVRIEADVTLGWHNTVASGVSAILVDDRWVALFGGYGADQHRLVVGTLEGGTVNPLRQYRLVLPGGNPLPSIRLIGRGPELHLLDGRDWYRLALADLAEVAEPTGRRGRKRR